MLRSLQNSLCEKNIDNEGWVKTCLNIFSSSIFITFYNCSIHGLIWRIRNVTSCYVIVMCSIEVSLIWVKLFFVSLVENASTFSIQYNINQERIIHAHLFFNINNSAWLPKPPWMVTNHLWPWYGSTSQLVWPCCMRTIVSGTNYISLSVASFSCFPCFFLSRLQPAGFWQPRVRWDALAVGDSELRDGLLPHAHVFHPHQLRQRMGCRLSVSTFTSISRSPPPPARPPFILKTRHLSIKHHLGTTTGMFLLCKVVPKVVPNLLLLPLPSSN